MSGPLNPFPLIVRLDDSIATVANSSVISLAKREVWLNRILRAVTGFAAFLWFVTAVLSIFSEHSEIEKVLVLLLSLAVATGELRLFRSHTLLVRRGWSTDVFALYSQAAAIARVVFLPFRMICLASLLVVVAQFSLSQTSTPLEVHAIFMTAFYSAKFYLERVVPPSGLDLANEGLQKASVPA